MNILMCAPLKSGILAGLLCVLTIPALVQAQIPELQTLTRNPDGSVTIVGEVPAGYRHAVLEVLHGDTVSMAWENFISGPLNGALNTVTFTIPANHAGPRCIVRMKSGMDTTVPSAPFSGTEFMLPSYGEGGTYVQETDKITHLLNRIAYGPSVSDYQMVEAIGVGAYISQQLAPQSPQSIDEPGNTALNSRVAELFYEFLPNTGTPFISKGDVCSYFEGTSEPPADWNTVGFAGTWTTGPMGLGYGDGDDATVLAMSGNYTSVYVRLPFTVADPGLIENLVMNIDFDDGFVAYLNGEEVGRNNVAGTPPLYTATSENAGGNVDNDAPVYFDLTAHKGKILPGANVLAIQGHNASLSGSSDFSLNANLVSVADAPYAAIKGDRELQHLIHVRGVYANRQLQAVLGEFWENHFTTELPKVQDYFDNLSEYRAIARISDAENDRIDLQAEIEAGAVEFAEYEFFHKKALGNFGDLLLYSATSPAMLIYLDSVKNRKGAPNENYAREILELSAFGVDNGYTQADIEELARCFTGWTVRKVHPGDAQPFPDSARTPPTDDQFVVASETVYLPIGADWQYFKGTTEPPVDPADPGIPGDEDKLWIDEGYDDAGWLTGETGIGYGDGDDATLLNDMRITATNPSGYLSVYTRIETTIPDPGLHQALLLDIAYDDGVVVYLNGAEIGRSSTMNNAGTPPAFDTTSGSHEAGDGNLQISLAGLPFHPAPALNTIAVQIHNASPSSSDLSFIPRIVGVDYTPESVDITEAFGVWTFRFDPGEYDLDPKTIFAGTDYEIQIPARQNTDPGQANYYADGFKDAISVIDDMVANPAAAEFICVKLVNRFVSDGISLDTYQDRTAPGYLLSLMDDATAAWHSTSPAGNIATVMSVILDPALQINAFWLEGAHLGKVKNPIEFINSSFRALDADILDSRLPIRTVGLGMNLFTRAEPDGFDETGPSWMDTQSLLGRIKFVQGMSEGVSNSNYNYAYADWSLDAWLSSHLLTTPQEVINHLNAYVFGGQLSTQRQNVLLQFSNTDDNGSFSDYDSLNASQKEDRMRKLVSLILSAPEFQYQ